MERSKLVIGRQYQWTGYVRSYGQPVDDPQIVTMVKDDGGNYIPILVETEDDTWYVDSDTLSEVADEVR